ncbi:hypothetical protein FIU86_21170 (plasmid) [Roseovarius sp. THAF9]|nr:hypothetical protein FIU86_21170 [Roseovarius sp. THAF9]
MLNTKDLSRIKGFRFPWSVNGYAVWAYHRIALSLRDAEGLCQVVLDSTQDRRCKLISRGQLVCKFSPNREAISYGAAVGVTGEWKECGDTRGF